MFITSALKRFQAVIGGITDGKFHSLPPEKEVTGGKLNQLAIYKDDRGVEPALTQNNTSY